MAIRVRKRDGKVYSLEELLKESLKYKKSRQLPVKDNQIRVKRTCFLVNKKLGKAHAAFIETGSSFFISFFDEEDSFSAPPSISHIDSVKMYKIESSSKYNSAYLCRKVGEGDFGLEKTEENLYKIIHPKK